MEARGLATGSSVSLRELRRLSQGACAFPWNRSPAPIPEPTPTPVPSSPHHRGYPHPRHTSFTSSSKRCPGFSFSSSGELPASRLYPRLCSAAQVLTTAPSGVFFPQTPAVQGRPLAFESPRPGPVLGHVVGIQLVLTDS